MHRMAIPAVAALIAALAVAIQLGLPRLAERAAAQRLTRDGGHARVHLKAFPATDLLRKRGKSITVKGSGLVASGAPDAGNGGKGGGLADLAGFERVDIQVIGVHFGPLTISRLNLARHALDAPYEVTVQATVTGADIATFAGGRVGGFLSAAVIGSGTEIPLDARATLDTAGGRIRATSVRGSVAGLPAGPFVEALTAALAARF
jgi:hypothetical protein